MESSLRLAMKHFGLPAVIAHPNIGFVWRPLLTFPQRRCRAALLRVATSSAALPWTVLSGSYGVSEPNLLQVYSSLHSTLSASVFVPHSKEKLESQDDRKVPTQATVKHVLCLSNGHGEDTIAVTVLKELEAAERCHHLVIEALPLVGLGTAYAQAQIPIMGPSKAMPSGGFIYMDILQLLGDISAGLLSLTLGQWRAIVQWLDEKPDGFIIAVGDVFPLALAWLASRHSRRKNLKKVVEYAFIGTAKSEFYLQTDAENSPVTPKRFHVESLLGGVYLPWECALMADSNCRLVAPRDCLTANVLKRKFPQSSQAKVQDLGNPMMDGLHPTGALSFLEELKPARFITLLPGSRAPEVHANWCFLLEASTCISSISHPNKVIFLTPVVPSLEPVPFFDALTKAGWQPQWWKVGPSGTGCKGILSFEKGYRNGVELWKANNTLPIFAFEKANATILLLKGGFRDASHWAEAGIAMAGTGTEQLVGLGRPVFTLPGGGPQFTYTFAEAQSRLLGRSIFLCSDTRSLASKLLEVLADKALLSKIYENGTDRMGKPGGGQRIAEQLCISIFTGRE